MLLDVCSRCQCDGCVQWVGLLNWMVRLRLLCLCSQLHDVYVCVCVCVCVCVHVSTWVASEPNAGPCACRRGMWKSLMLCRPIVYKENLDCDA